MSDEGHKIASEQAIDAKLHEMEKCAMVLSRVNGNLRLAATQLDSMIATVTETNEIASGWVELWGRVHESNIE